VTPVQINTNYFTDFALMVRLHYGQRCWHACSGTRWKLL